MTETSRHDAAAAHPRSVKLIRTFRAKLHDLEHKLDGAEVRAANGIRATNTARANGWQDAGEDILEKCAPCFTLSAGRSGTMTLAQLGALSPQLESVHEPLPHLLTESFLCHRGDVGDAAFWDAVIAEARDWPIRNAYRKGRNWFETNNRLTFLAPHLAQRYPQSRFIVLVRHPEAFAESAIARGYYKDHVWDFARIRPQPLDPDHDRWPQMSQLEKVGWLWRSTYEIADRLSETIDPERLLLVRSEDLFQNQGDAVNNLFTFASSEPPPQASIAHLLAQKSNAQVSRAKGSRSADWDGSERKLFDLQVEQLTQKYGYEPRSFGTR